jgi:GTP-binding protein
MPGLRKRRRITEDLERLFAGRAVRTVEAAHVCLLVVDATEGVTEQEAKLGKVVVDKGRALVLVVNKWDTQGKGEEPRKRFLGELRRRFPHLAFADVLFLSALTGKGVHRIWDALERADAGHRMTVGTAPLNRWLQAVVASNPPPMHKHRPVRIYYGVQVGVRPPTFRFFCRMPQALSEPYKRFMISRFRAAFDCSGSPVRFQFRDRAGR